VAYIAYIAIATAFDYLAAVLDAWSRRVIGCAISRSIDARVAVAALKAALRAGQPLGLQVVPAHQATECAPDGGQFQAAVLTGCRAW
jgi:transposase InsO family protein